VEEEAAVLLEKKVSCMPVVNEDMRPVGIVTWRDFLRAMVEGAGPGAGDEQAV
jgi:acetoin utilization protein AcuB